jgi:crossover junction endodeoxyribonuclease RuvC
MRIIAIDPGYDRLGIAIIEGNNVQQSLLFSTCVTTNKNDPLPVRLSSLGESVHSIINDHSPAALAIETLFFNKNVKTALDVAHARGVLLYIAETHSLPVYEYSPQAIKIALTGHGNSDKTAVTTMVKRLVQNVPETALDDEYDAIAVGITHLAQHVTHR